VVASRSPGLLESVRDGETGLLVPHADPEALAAALIRLLDDQALRPGWRGRRVGALLRLGALLSRKPGGAYARGGRGGSLSVAAVRGAVHRYRVPLILIKVFLSFALFAYVVAKVSPRGVWSTLRPADPTMLRPRRGSSSRTWSGAGSGRASEAQGDDPVSQAASPLRGLFFNNFLLQHRRDIAISDASKHADRVSSVFATSWTVSSACFRSASSP
jgi:hypothetical protein